MIYRLKKNNHEKDYLEGFTAPQSIVNARMAQVHDSHAPPRDQSDGDIFRLVEYYKDFGRDALAVPIEVRKSQSLKPIMEYHSLQAKKNGRSMIRLTIPNQKYRQIGSMLTKTGQIGQNQVQMELTAVPPKHNRYQAIVKLHQATKSIVSISEKRFSLH